MEKLIFKSKISDLFQIVFILLLFLMFSVFLILSDYFYIGIVLIIILICFILTKSKQVIVYNTHILVKYYFFKSRSYKLEYSNILSLEVISAIFMTPNISIVLSNKKRVNFEFGSKRNFINLINFFILYNIRIIDKSRYIKTNFQNNENFWKEK